MTKYQHSAKKQVQSKKQAVTNPTIGPLQSEGSLELTGAFGREGTTVQTQAAWLSDLRMKSAQKHMLAAQIGRVQGNKHLQRLLSTEVTQPRQATSRTTDQVIQGHWLPGEEEEVQTKPLLQRHMADSQVIQEHWLPGEEEEVQTKLQRESLPEEEVRLRPAVQRKMVSRGFGQTNPLAQRRVSENLWGNRTWAGLVQREGETETAPTVAPPVNEDRVKLDPVTFTPAEIPADGKTTSQASVNATPGGRTIKWELVGDDYGSNVNATGLVTPGNDTKGQEKVTLQVKATDDKQAEASSTGLVTLWDAKFYQAKQDFPKFVAAQHKYPNFTIGLNGKFDLDYQPAANLATVTVKVKFAFPDDETPQPSIWNFFGLGNQKDIDAAEARHKAYRDSFMKQIKTQWSNRYQFKNVREPQSIWGKLNPTTVNVNVLEVDADQHFLIEVRQKTKGGAQVQGGVTKLFQGDDVPTPRFNPSTAQGELARVTRNTPTPILFANNSVEIPAADQQKLQFLGTYLSRINNPKFNIDIVGHASATGDLAQNQTLSEKRAQGVEAVLKGAGVAVHKINTSGVGQTGADKSDAWRKVDITSNIPVGWQNLQDTTAHEFGHMIGLGDEYAGGGSPTATHYNLVKKAFGQDYADQVAKRGDTDYASIMEGGNDVRIQHYVTFWSALCETTMKAAVPDPKFGYDDWKFVG